MLVRSGIALIYLLLLFTSAFTLSFTAQIIDGLMSPCGLGRLLVFLKYLSMNIFGQATGAQSNLAIKFLANSPNLGPPNF